MPGTDMKVTPEIGAPIMAMATTGHNARRSPVKNVELELPRAATRPIASNTMKYAAIAIITVNGDKLIDCVVIIPDKGDREPAVRGKPPLRVATILLFPRHSCPALSVYALSSCR